MTKTNTLDIFLQGKGKKSRFEAQHSKSQFVDGNELSAVYQIPYHSQGHR